MDELKDKITAILAWAEEQSHFDTTFIESLSEQLTSRGQLSDRQEAALDRIIEDFHIEVGDWL